MARFTARLQTPQEIDAEMKQNKKPNKKELNNFYNYVMSFYNELDGIYPIKNLTLTKVYNATHQYLDKIQSENNELYTWGGGDSLDRERVRDLLVTVKVKNKKNHVKAVEHLGKYSQHKPLLDEVIKMLDFLDEGNTTKN